MPARSRRVARSIRSCRSPPPAAGVAAASGGNHGAAVAYAASRLGVKARIFVPEISSPAKVAVIRSHGAEVVIGGARYADAQEPATATSRKPARCGSIRSRRQATIAGQGTAALEWESGRPGLDTVLVAVGGGGLISGVASWWAGRVKIVGVEPEGSRALHAALEAGGPIDVDVEFGRGRFPRRPQYGRARLRDLPRDRRPRGARDRRGDPRGAERALAGLAHGRGARRRGGARRTPFGRVPARGGERVGVLLCGANVDLAKLADAIV